MKETNQRLKWKAMTHSKCEVGIVEGAWLGSLLSSRGDRGEAYAAPKMLHLCHHLPSSFPAYPFLKPRPRWVGGARSGKGWQRESKRQSSQLDELEFWSIEEDVEEWEWGAHLSRSWRARRRKPHASATATCAVQLNSFGFLDENGNFSWVVVSHKLCVVIQTQWNPWLPRLSAKNLWRVVGSLRWSWRPSTLLNNKRIVKIKHQLG